MLRLVLVLITCAGAALPHDDAPLLRRIEDAASREPLRNGIETELRAAYILRTSHPAEAAKFLKRVKSRLASHPDLVPTKWMATSLFSLAPEEAENLILQFRKPAAFWLLSEHYLLQNRPEKAIAVLRKALADSGPALGYMGTALEKLTPLDPAGAVDIYFAMRASSELSAKYAAPINRAPVFFSHGLAGAALKHPAGVRTALARLLALFVDERFLTDVKYAGTVKVVVAGHEIETKNARETVLLRLGALALAVAPDLYKRYEALFDSRTAQVRGIADARAVAEARTQWSVPPTAPTFDFATAPFDDALAEWRKRAELNSRLGAAGTLIARTDLSATQKQAVIEQTLDAIRVADKDTRADAADSLIWYASRARLDDSMIRPAVELLVNSISESPSFVIDDHTTAMVRDHRIPLGPRNASLQARIALLELDEAHSGRYTFTLPALDGRSVALKELRGQVVLLNFWATWCGPCRSEKPILERVYRDLKDKGFVVLAITDEDPDVVRQFAEKFQIRIPILIDQTRAVFEHYAIQGIPKTLILDRDGRSVARPITISDEGALRKMLASAGVKP